MNRLLIYFSMLFFAITLSNCTTNDVIQTNTPEDSADLYEIKDAALGDYLVYNCERTDENRLPYGTAILKDGIHYINTKIAATATTLYLVKTDAQIKVLQAAGVPTADVKIVDMDGVQFFTNATVLKITSNAVSKMDLTALVKLSALEMNANLMSSLDLSKNVQLCSLRYSASSSALNDQKLSSISFKLNSKMQHIYLKDHNIGTGEFLIPDSYESLTFIDMSGNPGAPFELPNALFSQLTTKNGVVAEPVTEPYTGPTPKENYFQIPDLAFAEYLVYLTPSELPAGTAFQYTNGKIYIEKAKAATATILNVSKTAGSITKLQEAGVATADVKIADADGLQFFTGLTEFTATSNQFTTSLKLTTLTQLEKLQLNTAFVSSLDVSANTRLLTLNCNGSTKASVSEKLSAMDLSKNVNLVTLSLTNNNLSTIDVAKLTSLTSLSLSGNPGADFAIPASIFGNLTTKSGVISQ